MFTGSLGAELFLQRISLLGVIVGLVILLHGWRTLRAAAFPLAFLILMIPLPGIIYYELVIPLQSVASQLAAWILHAIALFPVQREGNVLILPSTSLEVAEACSGIRSLFSLLTITAMYAYLEEKSNFIRWSLCLLAFPIAVAGNAGRIVFAAISAELAGASAVEGWAHFLSGLFLFLFSTLLVVLCHALLRSVFRRVAYLRRPA
jgi:exosortase